MRDLALRGQGDSGVGIPATYGPLILPNLQKLLMFGGLASFRI